MEVDTTIAPSPVLTTHALASELDLQLSLGHNSSPDIERLGDAEESSISHPEGEDESEELEANEEEECDDDECDFSFVCSDACSPISAEDLFDNGQIRPIFPWLEKEPSNLGSAPSEDVAEGPFCAWSKRMPSPGESSSAAPDSCRKSNSTGFSKLRRFRDLLHRSHSDGRDKFLFLTKSDKPETTPLPPSSSDKTKNEAFRKGGKKVQGTVETKTTSSAKSKTTSSAKSKTTSSLSSYALHYGKKGEQGKRKSYLPYRQDLVGFFTNANAMSKNIHPY